jgi:hypothetical protein
LNEQQWEQLVSVMARLAEGDRAAVVTLYVEFGRVLTAVVRRHLGRFGVRDITRDELDGIVLDVCFAIEECAGAWDPSTHVPPWTWAERRVAKVVNRSVGQYADELDDRAFGLPEASRSGGSGEVAPLDLLDARDEPVCRLLRDAFDDARVSARDRQLLLETRLQASLGDPSPATTVGALFDMQPAAVRQAVKRTRDRLRRIADAEARYAPLTDLALLA